MKRIVKKLFIDNLTVKIFSVVLTVVLFILVRADKDKEIEISVPLVLEGIQDNKILLSERPTKIRVHLKGRITQIRSIFDHDISPYVVNLVGSNIDQAYTFDPLIIQKLLPIKGLRVISITPPSMVLRFDDKISREVWVDPHIRGNIATGYYREAVKVKPQKVVLNGPRSYIEEILSVPTEEIDVSNAKDTIELTVSLKLPSKSYLSVDTTKVEVIIPIKMSTRTVNMSVSVEIRNCPETVKCRIKPTKVPVSVSGAQSTVDAILADHSKLKGYIYVDLSNIDIQQSEIEVPLLYTSPEGINLKPLVETISAKITLTTAKKITTGTEHSTAEEKPPWIHTFNLSTGSIKGEK